MEIICFLLPINLKVKFIGNKKQIISTIVNANFIFKNKKPVKLDGVFKDITQEELLMQKMGQEKQKSEITYQHLHKSYLALGKINAQVAALAEINATFSSNLEWKDRLHYIIESIRVFMQADETLLFLEGLITKTFHLKNISVDTNLWKDMEIFPKTKIIKQINKVRRPLKFFKSTDFLDTDKMLIKDYNAMLVIPVIMNNQVVGLFVLMFKNPAVLEEIPTKLTLAYTSQMAIALMMSGELDHSLKKIF